MGLKKLQYNYNKLRKILKKSTFSELPHYYKLINLYFISADHKCCY